MSHKVNLVRVLTSATGNSTPITLGAAYSQLFMLPSEAGAMDGRTYTYRLVGGANPNDWEIGRGVYTASGTTLARTTVLASRINGTLGTSRISLNGTAQVQFIDSADDMDGVRGTRAVTGTSDTLNNSDLGFVVTYSNASAVAVSLAQASVSNLFLDGWACYVKNKGAGAVTITPATSTIDGAATLVLAQNQGALIWSDGTNYQSFSLRNDIGVPVRTDTAQSLTPSAQEQARSNIGVLAAGFLFGMTMSNNSGTPNSKIDVSTGKCRDDSDSANIIFSSGITLDCGTTGANGLDSGSLGASTFYHVFAIVKADGTAAVFASTGTGPTLPTGYIYKRRLGSFRTDAANHILGFTQAGDEFLFADPFNENNGSALTVPTSATLRLITVPTLFDITAKMRISAVNVSGAPRAVLIQSPSETSGVASGIAGNQQFLVAANGYAAGEIFVRTGASGQIRFSADSSGVSIYPNTLGWIDRRGRDG